MALSSRDADFAAIWPILQNTVLGGEEALVHGWSGRPRAGLQAAVSEPWEVARREPSQDIGHPGHYQRGWHAGLGVSGDQENGVHEPPSGSSWVRSHRMLQWHTTLRLEARGWGRPFSAKCLEGAAASRQATDRVTVRPWASGKGVCEWHRSCCLVGDSALPAPLPMWAAAACKHGGARDSHTYLRKGRPCAIWSDRYMPADWSSAVWVCADSKKVGLSAKLCFLFVRTLPWDACWLFFRVFQPSDTLTHWPVTSCRWCHVHIVGSGSLEVSGVTRRRWEGWDRRVL